VSRKFISLFIYKIVRSVHIKKKKKYNTMKRTIKTTDLKKHTQSHYIENTQKSKVDNPMS